MGEREQGRELLVLDCVRGVRVGVLLTFGTRKEPGFSSGLFWDLMVILKMQIPAVELQMIVNTYLTADKISFS